MVCSSIPLHQQDGQDTENESSLLIRVMEIDWPASEQEVPPGREQEGPGGQHLWEESWDDDDTNEEFSKQLKYAL